MIYEIHRNHAILFFLVEINVTAAYIREWIINFVDTGQLLSLFLF